MMRIVHSTQSIVHRQRSPTSYELRVLRLAPTGLAQDGERGRRPSRTTTSFLAVLFLACLILPLSAQAAIYYVDKASLGGTSSDSNPGTITAPWRTIGKANSVLQPGDTVYIRAGTYDEIIEPYNSGTEGSKITYKNYNDEIVLIRGEKGNACVVSLGWPFHSGNWNPKSYIVVDGFSIRHIDPTSIDPGGDLPPMSIFLNGENSGYNEIKNCKLEGQGSPVAGGNERAIVIDKSPHNIVENNYIDGWFYAGIILGRTMTARYNTIRGNTVLNCAGYYGGTSIDVGSSEGVMQCNLIENNYVSGNPNGDAIQLEAISYDKFDPDSNRGVIIRNNILCNVGELATDLMGAANIVIEGNIIYNASANAHRALDAGFGPREEGGGASISHGSLSGSRDIIIRNNIIYDNAGGILMEDGYKIYNNVIVYNNRDYTGPNSSYVSSTRPRFIGILPNNGASRLAIKNNIIGGHHGAEFGLGSYVADLDINNNIYFNDNGVKFTSDGGMLNFKQWKDRLLSAAKIRGKDSESVEADPLFVNIPVDPVGYADSHKQYDFHLQKRSPGIDKGAYLTKTTGSGNSGNIITVEDASYFIDDWNVVKGDLIQLDGQTQTARITKVDYANNILTLDTPLSWTKGQGISLAYSGAAPDIGAYEYTPVTILYGDVSGDGIVSAYDAALAAQAAVGLITLTPEQTKAAEVSGDGKVSAYDAALIAQRAVGLINKFPVEP